MSEYELQVDGVRCVCVCVMCYACVRVVFCVCVSYVRARGHCVIQYHGPCAPPPPSRQCDKHTASLSTKEPNIRDSMPHMHIHDIRW